jgi:hypothetical protein
MPKLVSEISAGHQFQRSATEGVLADSQTRVFRILLSQAGEVVDPQVHCEIKIGDPHPVNTNVYCVSWDIKFDGDSRMVMLATFNYQSTPASSQDSNDRNQEPPDLRPANWSTSASLIEVPAKSWRRVPQNGAATDPEPAVNPAGDMYDGVSRFEAIVTINIEQFETSDPTRHVLYAGCVNEDELTIGSLTCPPGSVMFRGVQCKPHVESWGDDPAANAGPGKYRGWMCNYEFAFRQNYVEGIWGGQATYDAAIGWDVAVPVTGFSVKCLLNAQDVEKAGMPLKHKSGKIENWPNGAALPDGVAAGQKARSMVLVHEYENGGASQLPSAQPIPLNMDGSPRSADANPKVLVVRRRPNPQINFINTFQLRLT